MMWVLANQADPGGRLYWGIGLGWTYLELATLYGVQRRETITPPHAGTEPKWFQVERTIWNALRVIDPDRPLSIQARASEHSLAVQMRQVAEGRPYHEIDPELFPRSQQRTFGVRLNIKTINHRRAA